MPDSEPSSILETRGIASMTSCGSGALAAAPASASLTFSSSRSRSREVICLARSWFLVRSSSLASERDLLPPTEQAGRREVERAAVQRAAVRERRGMGAVYEGTPDQWVRHRRGQECCRSYTRLHHHAAASRAMKYGSWRRMRPRWLAGTVKTARLARSASSLMRGR